MIPEQPKLNKIQKIALFRDMASKKVQQSQKVGERQIEFCRSEVEQIVSMLGEYIDILQQCEEVQDDR